MQRAWLIKCYNGINLTQINNNNNNNNKKENPINNIVRVQTEGGEQMIQYN